MGCVLEGRLIETLESAKEAVERAQTNGISIVCGILSLFQTAAPPKCGARKEKKKKKNQLPDPLPAPSFIGLLHI